MRGLWATIGAGCDRDGEAHLACISGVIRMGAGAKNMQKTPKHHNTSVITFLGWFFTTLLVTAMTLSPPPVPPLLVASASVL